MAFNLEKLSTMAKSRSEEAKQKALEREKNRDWIQLSQDIALALHYYLRKKNISKKELAEKMDVSPAYISKLLKGEENLTLETISKLQKTINQKLIFVLRPYERKKTI